jgi:transposase
MVLVMRTYKRKRLKTKGRGRMLVAAQLRGQGMSLRQIAAETGVSKDTVLRDLREWDSLNAKVSQLPVSKMPRAPEGRGENETAECDSNVVQLRRRA